jgi:hypothetical protein
MSAGVASWLNAQEHSGENIGETDTRVFFVELKGPSTEAGGHPTLGPNPG